MFFTAHKKAISSTLHIIIFFTVFVSSCYDDSELWERVRDYEYRITKLEEFCNQINSNLSSLREIVEAIQERDYVKDVIPVYGGSDCVGYSITFSGRDPITLFNGKNGTDAKTPVIGIKKGEDGNWYWTLDGEWLLDEGGNRIAASGKDGRGSSDGQDGNNGNDGKDGVDGKDGITPQLKIENDYWWVSYDNGVRWQQLGPAYQSNDNDGCPVIKSISQDEHFVTIVLANGETIQLTKQAPSRSQDEVYFNIENVGVQDYQKVVYNSNDYSYSRISYWSSVLPAPYNQIPNGKVILTDTDVLAVSRTLEYADNAGFSNSTVIQLDLSSKEYVLYNLEGEKVYYYRVYKDNDSYLLLNSGRFETKGAVRQLRIESQNNNQEWLNNVRDLGGWKASGNKRIRYGVIFRGPELNHITDGVETVYVGNNGISELKRLGVAAELDLRGGEFQTSVLGSDVDYIVCPLDLWFYRLNIFCTVKSKAITFANAIREILLCLRSNKSIYIHCQGGCDRTGALCAIIEGLCGVSENDINHDYELSSRDRSREYYTLAKGDSYDGDFKFAMEYIKGLKKYGGHFYVYYRGNYYSAESIVEDYAPVLITDNAIISALSKQSFGSLKDRFRLLMELGGLTIPEMDELEDLLCH